MILYSKLQSDALREAIAQIVKEAVEKKRNFTETLELQIGLKNYDRSFPETLVKDLSLKVTSKITML